MWGKLLLGFRSLGFSCSTSIRKTARGCVPGCFFPRFPFPPRFEIYQQNNHRTAEILHVDDAQMELFLGKLLDWNTRISGVNVCFLPACVMRLACLAVSAAHCGNKCVCVFTS